MKTLRYIALMLAGCLLLPLLAYGANDKPAVTDADRRKAEYIF